MNLDRTSRSNALLLFLLIGVTPVRAGAECQMTQIGRFPVEISQNALLIPGKLNGHVITILADTGADESMVLLDAATSAGLDYRKDNRLAFYRGRRDTAVYKAWIDEVTIGNYVVGARVWPVINASIPGEDIGMVLGADFWSKLDYEFNLADREILVWENRDCGKAPLAYWSKEFMMALLNKKSRKFIETEVLLNDTKVKAIIDSGSDVTVMDSKLARRIGFRADPDIEKEAADSAQVTDDLSDSFIANFDRFEMGDLTIKNARIRTFDMSRFGRGAGSMLRGGFTDSNVLIIGMDFLMANRLLVANSQDFLYLTYLGGRIFQTEWSTVASIETALERGTVPASGNLSEAGMEALYSGVVAKSRGDYTVAEGHFRRALDELERTDKVTTPDGAGALDGLSEALVRQEKYAESEPFLLRLIQVQEQIAGPEHNELVTPLEALGYVLIAQHKYVDAIAGLQRALRLVEKAFGADSQRAAMALVSLGTAFEGAANYPEAEAAYARSASIFEKVSGPDHVDTGTALVHLGRMSETQGRYPEAIRYYNRARDIFQGKPESGGEMIPYIDNAIENAQRELAD